jgi:hypothetical protein
MLKIRPTQIEAFESAEAAYFAPRMVQHLKDAFPKHCSFLGEDGIHEVIRYGIEQGRAYGFTGQSAVNLFIDLTLLLGRFFHADVQMPWASEILVDESFGNELTKAEWLHAAAIEYLNTVSGPDNEYIDGAQRRLLDESIFITTASVEEFTDETLMRLERIWPEKYNHIGEENLRSLIQKGITTARAYDIESEPGMLMYIGMMYMLGSGFDRDPLFSWAHQVLNNKEEQDEAASVERLHSEAINYLKQWCPS